LSVSFSIAAVSKDLDKGGVLRAYGRLPLYFIEKRGQFTDRVKFYVDTFGQTLYFTDEGIVFDFVRPIKESGPGTKSGKFS